MIKNTFISVALTLACVYAQAQDIPSRSDMMGQEVTPLRQDTATPVEAAPAPRRVISNAGRVPQDRNTGDAVQRDIYNTATPRRDDTGNAPGSVTDRSDGAGRRREKTVPSEFQQFLEDGTGKLLPVFGSEFFANAPNTFTPVMNAPLPADYILGPGDEVLIRGSGTVDIDYRAVIEPNGTIAVPTVGTILMAGVRAADASSVVRNAVSRLYKGVVVNVSFGQLRAITIYVVGQAQRPGTYTVSSMSTLVTALFSSGGPNANGSMRRVQVKRGGKLVAELDLYAFLARGDKSGDVKLLDGDSIFIPAAAGHVALIGKVNAPAIYELKTGADSIGQLLEIAGGLPVVADPRRAFLERIDSNRNRPRSVEQFALDKAGLGRALKDGDVLRITSITPDFSNAVVLRGNVDQPIRAPYRSGMRVSDLIPSRDYLISRAAVKRANDANRVDEEAGRREPVGTDTLASRIGNISDQINWDYAVIERTNPITLGVTLLNFNLGNVFRDAAGPDNVLLQPGDTVTIFSQKDVEVPIGSRQVIVRIEGEVKTPGVYEMRAEDTLQSLLARAGGPTSNAYLYGSAFYREQVRKEQEANLSKVADRLEAQLRSEQSRSAANRRTLDTAATAAQDAQQLLSAQLARESIARFRSLKPNGRIALGLSPRAQSLANLPPMRLQNGDRVIIPARPDFVHVFGSVNAEASPLWRPNLRVKDYLDAVGTTADADIDNVFVLRVDGSGVSKSSSSWFSGSIASLEIMPGDSIVVPEKLDKETNWTRFMQGTREWAQIFANFGLGAAAIKTLRN